MPLGRTQSIVAVDRRSGEMGAAVLSSSFSVASRTVWAEPGVGVVVAQGTVEPTYGSLGLALMKGGKSPAHALKSLLATDPRPAVRQVMLMDSRGRTAAHTGKACLPEAGFVQGRGFCVQASFASAKRVWRSMAAAFRGSKGPLAERLVGALEAGEAKSPRRGGGARSAAVLVVAAIPTNAPWEGRLLDLRVESAESPVRELREMLRVNEAYARAASAEELLDKGDAAKGRKEFAKAISMAPDHSELKLWLALSTLAGAEPREGISALRSALGRGEDARAVLKELTARGVVSRKAEG